MEFEDWYRKNKEVIPEKFRSFESGKAFEHCMSCDKYLLEQGTLYMIEKAIKKYPEFNTFDVIFEFAICEDCSKQMRNELSKESIINIENHFMENAGRFINIDKLRSGKPVSEMFTDSCIIKNIPEHDLKEYQLVAYCDGQHLSAGQPPLLLSSLAAEELQELISDKTRDELNRFSDDFLGFPPELRELMKDDLILI